LYDYASLLTLTLNFAPTKKVPPNLSLSSFHPPSASSSCPSIFPYEEEKEDRDRLLFPRLSKVILNLPLGSSYMDSRPKPLSRRISKLLNTFSPPHLILSLGSSPEITLASLLPEHLARTEILELASHHVGHLPSITKRSCPEMRLVRVRPHPAVRMRDLKLLCYGLCTSREVKKGGWRRGNEWGFRVVGGQRDGRNRGGEEEGEGGWTVRVEVRWVPLAREGWWDREMREEIEREVEEARRKEEDWVQGVVLMFDDEDDGGGDWKRHFERLILLETDARELIDGYSS
jgi:hypothetical protein